jgi:hypothetical protein
MNRNFSRDTRGTVTVEAVIALPVFVILFIGMFFVRDLANARLSANEEVRRCSWEYALNNNCEKKPPGCDHVVGNGHYGSLLPDSGVSLTDLGKHAASSNSPGFTAVENILRKFVDEYLLQAITKKFDARKTIEVRRPELFGGGKSVTTAKYGMACNVPTQKQNDIATAVWNQFKP